MKYKINCRKCIKQKKKSQNYISVKIYYIVVLKTKIVCTKTRVPKNIRNKAVKKKNTKGTIRIAYYVHSSTLFSVRCDK